MPWCAAGEPSPCSQGQWQTSRRVWLTVLSFQRPSMESSHDDRQLKACLYFEAHRVIIVLFLRTSKWQLRERKRKRWREKSRRRRRKGWWWCTMKISINQESFPSIAWLPSSWQVQIDMLLQKWSRVLNQNGNGKQYLSLVSYNWTVLNQTGVPSDSVYSNSHRLLKGIILSYLCKHTEAMHINSLNFHSNE